MCHRNCNEQQVHITASNEYDLMRAFAACVYAHCLCSIAGAPESLMFGLMHSSASLSWHLNLSL